MDTVYLLAILQGLLFIAFLLHQGQEYQRNFLLIAWLILVCLTLFHSYLFESGLIRQYIFLLGLDESTPYACGPVLYLYVHLITGSKQKLVARDSWHFLPFVLYSFIAGFSLFTMGPHEKMAIVDGTASQNALSILMIQGMKIIHGSTYAFLAFLHLKKFGQSVSKPGPILRMTLLFVLGIFLVDLLMGVQILGFFWPNPISTHLSVPILNLVFFGMVYLLVFFALKYPQLFAPASTTEKYLNSNLSRKDGQLIWHRLQKHMKDNKPYENPALTILELANQVGTSSKVLSQVINEYFGGNYTNFINLHRVEAFKQRVLSGYQKYTLAAVAEECGFSSKSSFHSTFKKFENCTPKQFFNSAQLPLAGRQ